MDPPTAIRSPGAGPVVQITRFSCLIFLIFSLPYLSIQNSYDLAVFDKPHSVSPSTRPAPCIFVVLFGLRVIFGGKRIFANNPSKFTAPVLSNGNSYDHAVFSTMWPAR